MAMLAGKVAFVTGGASGIGKATVQRFAQEGAKVALVDIAGQREAGQTVVDQIISAGGQAMFIPGDVSDAGQMETAFEQTVSKFGSLQIIFANAGINGVWAPIEELKPEEWDKTLAVNLKGTFLTLHFAIPHLRKSGGGSVIINSSVNGNRTFSSAGASAYSSSKAGQVAFMKMAALELSKYNIRVNAVLPGAIHTNIDQAMQKRDTEKVAIKVELPAGMPGIHHGQGEPEEVADVCLFLASDLSRHVSGAELYVDGGASLLM